MGLIKDVLGSALGSDQIKNGFSNKRFSSSFNQNSAPSSGQQPYSSYSGRNNNDYYDTTDPIRIPDNSNLHRLIRDNQVDKATTIVTTVITVTISNLGNKVDKATMTTTITMFASKTWGIRKEEDAAASVPWLYLRSLMEMDNLSSADIVGSCNGTIYLSGTLCKYWTLSMWL